MCLIKQNAMKAKLHLFFTLALVGDEWSSLLPGPVGYPPKHNYHYW